MYGRAVDNKLLVVLNTIGTQQASATAATNDAVNRLLNYMTTYPDDGIVYRSSDMVLAALVDADFHNQRDVAIQVLTSSLPRMNISQDGMEQCSQ